MTVLSMTAMTEAELRALYEPIYKFITDEKRMRQAVLSEGTSKERKLKACDDALAALISMKDFAKGHVEETPEQTVLFDDLPQMRGGY